ncbi:SitA6 family polymorphic toxin lipoprotein [Myxococcus qinghaiensis]|uniref:SitA6 family polymorphic toxin lipoprotein n=1 Tax=Myxococcus qinghaiensis TaxID=2906758 RepID=UPI0020A80081|nr:TIGR02269 family lipoprotein [Myxococcus qinghaiensis]MCP3163797.1 TIGR02269 family lipoprotein [Myxococcus qinghaiensis]
MRIRPVWWWALSVVTWLGCATVASPAAQADAAVRECDTPASDQCVKLLCLGDACGFYRCEDDLSGDIERALFPPARPPAAAAAPGQGPRRNWGGAQNLPRGAVMTFPNWNGAPERIIPPSRQLTPGRWEKHHIFPQAQDLAMWFEAQGVKIHDYTMPIPRDLHRRIHDGTGRGGAWNDAWREFIFMHPSAPPEAIYRHAGELIHRFQLIDGPIQPYYSRPGA